MHLVVQLKIGKSENLVSGISFLEGCLPVELTGSGLCKCKWVNMGLQGVNGN